MKSMKSAKSNGGGGKKTSSSGKNGKSGKASAGPQANESAGENAEENSELMEFFVHELKDIYWAEKFLVKSLPKMSKAASSEELKNAFDEHLSVTEEHVNRLEEVFSLLDMKPSAEKCEAMDGLVKEANEIIEETKEGTVTRDAALIIAAQKVEHYEIATYGSLRTLARVLKHEDVAELLSSTLDEEKEADETLTGVAESHINEEASQE